MPPIRQRLNVPYAEKDEAKALGARWDPDRKTWYVNADVDLAPFQKWSPDAGSSQEQESVGSGLSAKQPAKPAKTSSGSVITTSVTTVPHCGCNALPWVECEHTAKN